MNKKNTPAKNKLKTSDRLKDFNSMHRLSADLRERERRLPIGYWDFYDIVAKHPDGMFRDIFQLFHDMIHNYVPEGVEEYDESESVGFVNYDFNELFVENFENPFFADRLFANRMINMVNSFRKGTQKNNIFLFEGPPRQR